MYQLIFLPTKPKRSLNYFKQGISAERVVLATAPHGVRVANHTASSVFSGTPARFSWDNKMGRAAMEEQGEMLRRDEDKSAASLVFLAFLRTERSKPTLSSVLNDPSMI